ncbi:FAD-dependent oxidoreductase [Thermococcus sp. ES12]|uniref:FAD-dependent oxidoreductase n=1 Tax=Thermococcus sp. ES12 TaxID=1638246 RepID=UPI00143208A0|nr:GMC family oxidoreductase [Thermococcus sp. ES12]NJE75520.1 GMC family oxidoreductase [Thermococcus sp. ES12]
MKKHAEYLVVGSGAGGATIARELSMAGKDVLIVEAGKYEEHVGTFRDSLRYFETTGYKTPRTSREGVILWRAIMAGGSTVVSCANGTRCLQEEFKDLGINLESEFREAEGEMKIAPTPKSLLSEASLSMLEVSADLGYKMEPMPKFLDFSKCVRCGCCTFGCLQEAKWTALDYLNDALARGADVLYETRAHEVVVEDGRAIGIRGSGKGGYTEITADNVILAAGALSTPVTLQNSGVKNAGGNLFIDILVNVYGRAEGLHQAREPSMALVDHEFHDERGFILSPYININRTVRFMEAGRKGFMMPTDKLLGIMVKTADDPTGRVYPGGSVSKGVTRDDQKRLDEGAAIAKEILDGIGADPGSFVVSKPEGAHFGGTAAIGAVVDEHLETEIRNLYVCDASVLPKAPGMPPILTIVALAKWLGKALAH